MSALSERVVVLMTPAEKRGLEAKARRLGASAGELVRRSLKAYDPQADNSEIEAMVKLLVATHRRTLAALDKAERELAETRSYFARKRGTRAR